jgi:5-methyltetrahydropteroyltriglutamate--homocysteine methyltransferase
LSDLRGIRTDVVGSLLRPAAWKEARLRYESGLMAAKEFAEVEKRCLENHVRLQESVGLDVVTDGELSRLNFQDSFGLSVSGYAVAPEKVRTQEERAAGGTPLSRWDIPDLAGPGTPVVHRRPAVARLGRTASRSASITRIRKASTRTWRPSWPTWSRYREK